MILRHDYFLKYMNENVTPQMGCEPKTQCLPCLSIIGSILEFEYWAGGDKIKFCMSHATMHTFYILISKLLFLRQEAEVPNS